MIAKFPSTYSAAFVSKLNSSLNQLLYSSFLGGGNFSAAHALALDSAGNVFLAGSTQAAGTTANFVPPSGLGCPISIGIGPTPTPPPIGGDDPFVLKMTLSAAPPAFFTTFGGSCHGEADSLAFDAAGNIWLAGMNASADFPSLAPVGGLGVAPFSYFQSGFLAELNPPASALLSSTFTDAAGAVAASPAAVYYSGGLEKLTSPGTFSGNLAALVAEINPVPVASIFIDKITQYSPLTSASGRPPAAVAPGEIVRLLGRGIGPQTQAKARLTSAGTLATSIGGVQVTFNGVPAPLVTAQANEIVAIAPFELNGLFTAPVQVQYNGLTSNTYTAAVVPQNPDVIAVTNSDWSVNSPTNPAKPGSGITIFLTGLGVTNPPSADGAINQPPLAQPAIVPAVDIDGSPAYVTFIGAASGEVAGVMQLNLMLPPTPEGANSFWIAIAYGSGASVYVGP
jgi:uncharacterized protein (TIGR03437 family)